VRQLDTHYQKQDQPPLRSGSKKHGKKTQENLLSNTVRKKNKQCGKLKLLSSATNDMGIK
jgi:hypothetical protein